MLEIKSIEKVFNKGSINQVSLFEDFSLTIHQGDFITVIGSNGAGKSTLLNMIAGDLSIDQGEICYMGEDISRVSNYKRASVMSRVFQNPSSGVSPQMTILENLSMAWNKANRNPFTKGIRKSQLNTFKALLKSCDLGLEEMMDKKVHLLSGGQKQALSLMMAIIHKPKILLLDEHTAALDPNTAQKILEITGDLVAQNQVTTVMITHNMTDAITYGNRLIMLDSGKVILDLMEEEKKQYTSEKLIKQFKALKMAELEDRLALI